MAIPTVFPEWATDAVFTAAPGVEPAAVGQPTRVAPSPAEIGQGTVPGLGFVAEHHNYTVGKLCDLMRYVFTYGIDSDGDHTYETPKSRVTVYPASEGFAPLGGFSPYNGTYVTSTDNESHWIIPLNGIPVGAQIQSITARVKTSNGVGVTRVIPAKFQVLRYSRAALLDVSNPLDYDSGAGAGWSVYLGGFPAPGPFVGNFPAVSTDAIFGPSQPFFIESGYRYAFRMVSGVDSGVHAPDKFAGLIVEWRDFGPRSGG